MNIIQEALRELHNQKITESLEEIKWDKDIVAERPEFKAPDMSYLDNSDYDSLYDIDDEIFTKDVNDVLRSRFLGMIIEGVPVGTVESTSWYDPDEGVFEDLPIRNIRLNDDYDIEVSFEGWPSYAEDEYGDVDMRSRFKPTDESRHIVKLSDLGLSLSSSPKELLERFINIPEQEFYRAVVHGIKD